jgi:LmbE family N-acetylglucosaminyl deacetylase
VTDVIVVAPHPDDEVLGCSAVLSGAATTVVHVTDGVPPWTAPGDRDGLRLGRQAEAAGAWDSLSSRVNPIRLGFGDLLAWREVEAVSESLYRLIAPLGVAHVYLPAYQRGHPDHDAVYIAGSLARQRLAEGSGLVWRVYGLYGFDQLRHLQFGSLPAERYGPIERRGGRSLLAAKARALRLFTSQTWPGSALDLWLRSPAGEEFAPLPALGGPLPAGPCFYDEQLGFGRHGASAAAVEAEFLRVLASRVG